MSEVAIRLYNSDLFVTWENIIDTSINGTIFHRQKYLNYHPKDRFQNNSLIFEESKSHKILSVFPAAIIENDGQKILKSHPGSSYGGFVFDQQIPMRKIYSMLESLDRYCMNNNIRAVEFRQAPKIFNLQYCDQLEYALVKNGYVRLNEELATFYRLDEFTHVEDFDTYLMQFPQKTRNEIRKAHKNGVYTELIRKKSDLARFHEILCTNLITKHNKQPVHSLQELEKLIELFPDKVFAYGIYLKQELIGGFLVLQVNKLGWHVFYAPINYDYQEIRPLNLGVVRLIQYAIEKGLKVLNYGVSTPDSGKKVNWGLLRFKENFNGKGVLRTYWKKEFNGE